MTLAVFPGSFDPVTNGHLSIVERASKVFDQVIVALGVNPLKPGWLPQDVRERVLREAVSEQLPNANVQVLSFEGLLADLLKELEADAVVKGVRGSADLQGEAVQAQVNFDLCGVDTFLLPSRGNSSYVSSSLVRELAMSGGPISAYVPPAVVRTLSGPDSPLTDTSIPRSQDA